LIPWASPVAQFRAHKDAIMAAVARVLDSGAYILGSEVEGLEREFAEYCGVTHAVGVGSGTDALILGLRALGIGAGDEVIAPSHTALATIAAILATGATPVLADVDPVSYTIDPASVEEAISPRTRAVIAVHLYGRPADLEAIGVLARQHKLWFVEDCAQATGAGYGGRRVGSIGDIGCFSLYPTKNLGAIGDGGLVTTSDAEVAARLRRLRQYGWNDVRETEEPGLNSRLDPVQAAIVRVKLPYLDGDNARRRSIAQQYGESLGRCPIELPAEGNAGEHAFHLYVIGCDNRDGLATHLAKNGVGSAIHYPAPAHRHKGYFERVRIPGRGLPVTDRIVGRILSLPMYPELSDAEVDQVVAAVRGYFAGR
jgi:dTDP-4-amino-4,6-dideoxygalactose transaminase